MENIHKTIEQEMDWVEIDDLYKMLKHKSDIMKSQSLYLRTFLIEAVAFYILNKNAKEQNTNYNMRIKGSCIMALSLCYRFGYISKGQYEQYEKILKH